MRKNGRKEITMIRFEGVATDGGFIFEASMLLSNIESNMTKTTFKAIAYADGVMEIAIDYSESISKVAELVSGMFSRKSNFANLDSVILNYRNIRLQINNTTGRKDIICMLMKAMAMPGYKDCDNNISIDTQTCQKINPLRDSDIPNMQYEIYANSFLFDEIYKCGKILWFANPHTGQSILISSIKDGIVTVDGIVGDLISDFVEKLRKFFVPYSNFYGVKAIEFKFNDFSIKVDEQNVNKILYLYKRSCEIL